MDTKDCLQQFGLVPRDEDLPMIREMLAQEADLERKGQGGEREEDLALLCSVQLFSRGHLEDVLRIWDAKSSGFDLFSYWMSNCFAAAAWRPPRISCANSTARRPRTPLHIWKSAKRPAISRTFCQQNAWTITALILACPDNQREPPTMAPPDASAL